MIKALVPVDGSRNSQRAVKYLVDLKQRREAMEIHLLNVQEAADSLEVRRFRLPQEIKRVQRRRGAEKLRAARALLDKAGVRYKAHVLIGGVPETIVRFAKQRGCDTIIMGTRGMTSLANLLLGSVATKVIHLARVPVTLVK